MTCLEKFKIEHPSSCLARCHHNYGYAEQPKLCYEMSCIECWNRECVAQDNKEDKNV